MLYTLLLLFVCCNSSYPMNTTLRIWTLLRKSQPRIWWWLRNPNPDLMVALRSHPYYWIHLVISCSYVFSRNPMHTYIPFPCPSTHHMQSIQHNTSHTCTQSLSLSVHIDPIFGSEPCSGNLKRSLEISTPDLVVPRMSSLSSLCCCPRTT